jgi:hypothetical protein
MSYARCFWIAFCAVLFVLPVSVRSAGFDWQPEVQLRGTIGDSSDNFFGGSFIQRLDGKMLVTYRSGSKVMLSYVDSEDELLTVNNASAKNEWEFRTLYSPELGANDSRLQRLKNGRILLYVVEHGVEDDLTRPFRVDVYESRNGLGTDFRLKSRMANQSLLNYSFGARAIGNAIEIKKRIYVPLAMPVDNGDPDRLDSNLYCAVSKDGGRTWQLDRISPPGTWRNPTRGFGVADNHLIALDQSYYAGGETIFRSKDLAAMGIPNPVGEWAAADPYQQNSNVDMVVSHLYHLSDGYTYFQYNPDAGLEYFVYQRPSRSPIDGSGQKPYQIGSPGSGATWTGPINSESYGDDGNETMTMSPSGHIVLSGTTTYIGTRSHMFVGRKVRR